MWHRIGKQGTKYWGQRGAGIIFTDGTSMLLLRRSEKGDNKGRWGLPGGKAEDGETMLGTAQRETREEIGKLPELARRITHIDSTDGRHHFRTYVCEVPKRFECELSDEHDDYGWYDLNDVKNLNLHPKLGDLMDDIIEIIGSRKQHLSEMSGFAEFVSLSEMMGSTGAVMGTHPPTPPKHSDYNIMGAAGRSATWPKDGPIKPKKKRKKAR